MFHTKKPPARLKIFLTLTPAPIGYIPGNLTFPTTGIEFTIRIGRSSECMVNKFEQPASFTGSNVSNLDSRKASNGFY